jgi:hypothetical protein
VRLLLLLLQALEPPLALQAQPLAVERRLHQLPRQLQLQELLASYQVRLVDLQPSSSASLRGLRDLP